MRNYNSRGVCSPFLKATSLLFFLAIGCNVASAFHLPGLLMRYPTSTLRLANDPSLPPLKTSDDYYHEATRLYREHFGAASSGYPPNGETDDILGQATTCLETAIDLEATKLNQQHNHCNCDNLLVALRALATVHATQNKVDQCLQVVDEIRYWKSRKMPFPIEDITTADKCESSSAWEWICTSSFPKNNNGSKVALRTVGDEPWLDATSIAKLQEAAQDYRDESIHQDRESSTRFTMQYAGNSDLHVADLVAHQPDIQETFHELLTTKVYPSVRQAFLSDNSKVAANLPLCVYDALIVRYDGDVATKQGRSTGASLPLHRDGGLFSVNIALQQNHTSSGGTLFDRLLLSSLHDDQLQAIQKATVSPLAPGYAVVHRSTERHAGAPTQSGVREILVIFLTLQPPRHKNCPPSLEQDTERSFYLKELAQKQQLPVNKATIQRLYKWAALENPLDGEALFWMSYSQIQNAKAESRDRSNVWNDLQSGITGLERVANELDPCNVRTLAFLGTAFSVRWRFAVEYHAQAFGLIEEDELEKAAAVLKRAVYLSNIFEVVFGSDDRNALLVRATLLIQLAEVLLQQGHVQRAEQCLGKVPAATRDLPEALQQELRKAAKEMLNTCA